MILDGLWILRSLTLVTVLIYFAFELRDRKTVKDEREELIRLKTYELMHKLTAWSLTLIAFLFVFFPHMPAIYPVMTLVFASMYGEIGGKIYYRRKY